MGAFINEHTLFKEAVTQRATWTLCPVTPRLTLSCRFICISDAPRWPSSFFDETLRLGAETQNGSLWCRVYHNGLESRCSAAWGFNRPHWGVDDHRVRFRISPKQADVRLHYSWYFLSVRIRLSPAGCGCNVLLFADIRDVVCLPW